MTEIDVNNLPCPFCDRVFQFVMVVYGPWTADTEAQQAGASVDFVHCPCGGKYTREGWSKETDLGAVLIIPNPKEG